MKATAIAALVEDCLVARRAMGFELRGEGSNSERSDASRARKMTWGF